MPRVHFVQKARKDNPAVKAGESYYWWKFRYGGKRYSATRPRQSQLTQSPYFGTVYSLMEEIEDTSVMDEGDLESLRDSIQSQIEDLGQEAQDSLDNMPDSLQYSPTGELLQERVDACETASDEISSIDIEFDFDEDEPQPEDYDDEVEFNDEQNEWEERKSDALESWLDNQKQEITDALDQCIV